MVCLASPVQRSEDIGEAYFRLASPVIVIWSDGGDVLQVRPFMSSHALGRLLTRIGRKGWEIRMLVSGALYLPEESLRALNYSLRAGRGTRYWGTIRTKWDWFDFKAAMGLRWVSLPLSPVRGYVEPAFVPVVSAQVAQG